MENSNCANMSRAYNDTFAKDNIFHLSMSIISIIFSALTVFLNMGFLITVLLTRTLKNLRLTILVVLSCIDLAQGLISWPMSAYISIQGIYGNFHSMIALIYRRVSGYMGFASILVIFTITLEQYCAVVHPFFHQRVVSKKRLIWPLLLMNLLICGLGVLLEIATEFFFLIQYLLYVAMVILVAVVVYLFVHIWSTSKEVQKIIITQNRAEGQRIQREAKAAKTGLAVLIAFVVCYIPRLILFLFETWYTPDKPMEFAAMRYAAWTSGLLALTKCTWNPIIYYWRLRAVRTSSQKLLRKHCCINHISDVKTPPTSSNAL